MMKYSMKLLKEIYEYREMLVSLVKRDLRGRYKGSVLGFLWTFLNPLLQLVVYSVVFSQIMRSGIESFYLFLFVALVPWLFFSACLTGGSGIIFAQQDMVKKIYFPREILPLSFVVSQLVNMLLCFVVIFAVLIISGWGINFMALLWLPLVMAVEFLLCLGFTLILSGLTVYFRDLEYIMGIISMAWMYLTPILYAVDQVPEELQRVLQLNPVSPIIIAYRDILYYKQVPEVSTLVSATLIGLGGTIIGLLAFSRLKRHFVEEL